MKRRRRRRKVSGHQGNFVCKFILPMVTVLISSKLKSILGAVSTVGQV